ncbi:hypothetical protein RJ639_043117 [Escallonia herrerae]|uniref:Gnk2-homologous domain-containing protein n=1 Tax=Escallonia herrerae TaxID=1293975 RepID=A0AA89B2W9_9ASTE|nr:hypothetical protein RJ639_043117 [Escallonia herrerae]
MGLLPKMAVLVATLLIAFLGEFSVVRSDPNSNVTNVLCNGDVYANDDPFAISLAYVVAELESVTSSRQGYDCRNISPYPNAFAYGHAACNQNLTSSDCTTCLGAAKTAMFSTCDNRIGARSVLVDCTIRVLVVNNGSTAYIGEINWGKKHGLFISSRSDRSKSK